MHHHSKQHLFDHLVSTGLQHRPAGTRLFQCFALIQINCQLLIWRNVLSRRLHRRGPADLDRPGGYGLPEDIEATPSEARDCLQQP